MDQSILDDMQEKMAKSVDSFSVDLAKVQPQVGHMRSYRSHQVSPTVLKCLPQVATVSVEGVRSLLVSAGQKSSGL